MIISLNEKAKENEFLNLMKVADSLVRYKASDNPEFFVSISPTDFEKELYNCFVEAAGGTDFEGAIELIGGHKFPDIVAQKIYGVEVKTTKKNKWISTGNSILESTRVPGVENIYIYFAKLVSGGVDFKYRPYAECLYNIGVTHSPRYLIDMELADGESIFDKMGVEYNELRLLDNPVEPFKQYLRDNINTGEEPWWFGSEYEEHLVSPVVKLFNSLPSDMRKTLREEAMVFFPQVFGNSQNKYASVATWLAAKHGVVNPSLRDVFTAGGQADIQVGGVCYQNMPRIFRHLYEGLGSIVDIISQASCKDLEYYWDKKLVGSPLEQWFELVCVECVKPEEKILVTHIQEQLCG